MSPPGRATLDYAEPDRDQNTEQTLTSGETAQHAGLGSHGRVKAYISRLRRDCDQSLPSRPEGHP